MSLIISVNAFSKASGNCRAWVPFSLGLRLRREPGFQPEFTSPAGQVWEASPGTQQSVPAPVTGHNLSPSGRVVASLPVPCPQKRRQSLGGRFGGCIRRGLPPNLLTKAPQGAAASVRVIARQSLEAEDSLDSAISWDPTVPGGLEACPDAPTIRKCGSDKGGALLRIIVITAA